MNKKELLNGRVFTFKKYMYVAEVSYGGTVNNYNTYKIWFQGEYIKNTKTYAPVAKKILELKRVYRLSEVKTDLKESVKPLTFRDSNQEYLLKSKIKIK